jgi:hypothetical protein
MDILSTIENTGFSQFVRESGSIWAFPTILVVHTMGMATVAGLSGLIDLRLLGMWPEMRIKPLERLYPLMWWGFIINAITGTMLLMADASTKLRNPDFYIKMVLIFIGIVVLRRMRTAVFANPSLDSAPVTSDARTLAMVSLACWLGAITCGRLLAYVGPVAGLVRSSQ